MMPTERRTFPVPVPELGDRIRGRLVIAVATLPPSPRRPATPPVLARHAVLLLAPATALGSPAGYVAQILQDDGTAYANPSGFSVQQWWRADTIESALEIWRIATADAT